jgi:hypothetical protein
LSVPTLSFKITEDLLNSLLMNVTLSIMASYGLWNTTTNVTTMTPVNVYEFSRPMNLYFPYGVGLLLALVFIVLGALALRQNGVSATDGGFIQLITTTTGSSKLNEAAAGGCLGGSENVPQQLKDLKIRFGETVDAGEGKGLVKRAGFGVEDEVRPLNREARYGIST